MPTTMPRGLPRPRKNWTDRDPVTGRFRVRRRAMPHAYSSKLSRHNELDELRAAECRTDELCGVCGDALDADVWSVVAATSSSAGWSREYTLADGSVVHGHVVDSLPMHRRCCLLALRWCPEFRGDSKRYRPMNVDIEQWRNWDMR